MQVERISLNQLFVFFSSWLSLPLTLEKHHVMFLLFNMFSYYLPPFPSPSWSLGEVYCYSVQMMSSKKEASLSHFSLSLSSQCCARSIAMSLDLKPCRTSRLLLVVVNNNNNNNKDTEQSSEQHQHCIRFKLDKTWKYYVHFNANWKANWSWQIFEHSLNVPFASR